MLIARAELERRVRELGAELSRALAAAERPPILIAVLRGSVLFLADLVRAMTIAAEVDFMSISAYAASDRHSGVVRIEKDLELDIHERDVVIVEDIVDTGLTLNYLRRALEARHPRSLRTVSLLDKSARRIVPVPLEHRGFEIPDVFVVGYGLDFQALYRNVPEVLAVRDLARMVNHPAILVGPLFGASAVR